MDDFVVHKLSLISLPKQLPIICQQEILLHEIRINRNGRPFEQKDYNTASGFLSLIICVHATLQKCLGLLRAPLHRKRVQNFVPTETCLLRPAICWFSQGHYPLNLYGEADEKSVLKLTTFFPFLQDFCAAIQSTFFGETTFSFANWDFFFLFFSKTKGEEMPHLESAIKRRTAISDSRVKYAKNSSSQCCGCRQRGGHSNPVWRTHNLSDARANTNGNVQQMCKDLSPPTKKGTFIDNRNLRKLAVVHQSFFLSSFSKFLV